MTKQEIFDKVVNHLKTQRQMSNLPNQPAEALPLCAYRGHGDCKCAIGIFIPDDGYSAAMEGSGVAIILSTILAGNHIVSESHTSFELNAAAVQGLAPLVEHRDLAAVLQRAHDAPRLGLPRHLWTDEARIFYVWRGRLAIIADDHELVFDAEAFK